ncbi:hypothetical protein HOV30_gp181 [Erwinia phage Derbicus]|uniref:Uncharacterized protein n=2 Tax=Derbicusvirus derbicus TaxID=2734104 RepID=A0A482IJ85_9CAUD|nr:hypothetical protein BIZ82_gp182 [Erwinia phage vB_EamM_EarlPhillipIV]YP_009821225.1 hypothetical protein HOV30_gp181 [Erwinia phage Derbicus]ANZ49031.1 hypothetical protein EARLPHILLIPIV_182 [Erwinia phage vB_EamM_EarlPhillipIV]QBP07607.1 hypothetical protein DERBICUS_181 [Erwinia phage Derbicus]
MNADDLILFQKFLGVLSIGVALIVVVLAIKVGIDKYVDRNNYFEEDEESSNDDDVAHEARTLPHSK